MDSFFVPAAGAHMRLHDLPGREPALIFIHGLGASAAQAFVDVCRRAPLRERRCVLADLLGYGHSDRPTSFSYSIEDHALSIAALLDALHLRHIVLVGHSMGGAVVITLARARPDLVARLILVEAHLDPETGSVSGPVLAQSEAEFTRSGHADLVRTLVSQGLVAYAGAFQTADPVAIHRTARSLVAARRPSFREMLIELSMPAVSLFGGKNVADPDTRWLPEHGVPVHVIAGAGHDVMTDQPDGFAAELATLA